MRADFIQQRFDIVADMVRPCLGISNEGIARATRITRYLRFKELLDQLTGFLGQDFQLVGKPSAGFLSTLWSQQDPENKTGCAACEGAQNSGSGGAATG